MGDSEDNRLLSSPSTSSSSPSLNEERELGPRLALVSRSPTLPPSTPTPSSSGEAHGNDAVTEREEEQNDGKMRLRKRKPKPTVTNLPPPAPNPKRKGRPRANQPRRGRAPGIAEKAPRRKRGPATATVFAPKVSKTMAKTKQKRILRLSGKGKASFIVKKAAAISKKTKESKNRRARAAAIVKKAAAVTASLAAKRKKILSLVNERKAATYIRYRFKGHKDGKPKYVDPPRKPPPTLKLSSQKIAAISTAAAEENPDPDEEPETPEPGPPSYEPFNDIDIGGRSLVLAMSDDDIEELLERISRQCPIDDVSVFEEREKEIDWKDVAFSYYGPVQCKKAWNFLRSHTRTYRIMHEIVEEVRFSLRANFTKFVKKVLETAPGFPKMPRAVEPFQVYAREMYVRHKENKKLLNKKVENFLRFKTKIEQDWIDLDDVVREKYERKAELNNADYQRKLKEYYAKFPTLACRTEKLKKGGEVKEILKDGQFKDRLEKAEKDLYADAPKFPYKPCELFINSKLNRLEEPPLPQELIELVRTYRQEWTELPDDTKLYWIDSCIWKAEEYIEAIQKYKLDHPLFTLPKDKRIPELLTRKEFLLWIKHNHYGEPPKPDKQVDIRLRKRQLDFFKKFDEYYERLPMTVRSYAVHTIPPIYRKMYLERVDTEPLVLDTEVPEMLTKGKTKYYSMGPMPLTSVAKADESLQKKENEKGIEEESGEVEVENEGAREKEADCIAVAEEREEGVAEKRKSNNPNPRNYTYRPFGAAKYVPITVTNFFPGRKILHDDLNEAIRGFFDGHQGFRYFSVYYYYARHVSQDPKWLQMYNTIGIVPTVTRIMETFNRLSKHQQQTFLDEAFAFFGIRNCGRKLDRTHDITTQLFPDEPRPPPKTARLVYNREVKEMKRKDRACEPLQWEELDEKTQMFYMKRLYWLTREYIHEYEEFIKNLSPNDLVDYVVQKNHNWELYTSRKRYQYSEVRALNSLAHPPYAPSTYSTELDENGPDPEPELYQPGSDGLLKRLKCHGFRYKNNPFSVNEAGRGMFAKNALVQRLTKNKKGKKKKVEDPDLPSSCEEEEEYANLDSFQEYRKKKQFLKQLREKRKYCYPLANLYEETSITHKKAREMHYKWHDLWKQDWLSEEEKAKREQTALRLISWSRDRYQKDVKRGTKPTGRKLMARLLEEKETGTQVEPEKDKEGVAESEEAPPPLQPPPPKKRKRVKSSASDNKDVVLLDDDNHDNDQDQVEQSFAQTPSATDSSPTWTPIQTPREDRPRHPRLSLVAPSSSPSVIEDEPKPSKTKKRRKSKVVHDPAPESSPPGRKIETPEKQEEEEMPHDSRWGLPDDDVHDMFLSQRIFGNQDQEDVYQEMGIFADQFTEEDFAHLSD